MKKKQKCIIVILKFSGKSNLIMCHTLSKRMKNIVISSFVSGSLNPIRKEFEFKYKINKESIFLRREEKRIVQSHNQLFP